ncbi:hypothetical protein HQ587_06125 [bacterium]|nr:hypothetical protein [bacterium]
MEYNWAELKEYRKREIKEAVSLINGIWKGKSPDYLQGVIDMFSKVLLLPKKLCREDELEFIEDMVSQEFKLVEVDLLREAVRE